MLVIGLVSGEFVRLIVRWLAPHVKSCLLPGRRALTVVQTGPNRSAVCPL